MGWAGLTPVVGRAAQVCLSLFSGSWGSSLTNPLTLYLENMFGDISEILSVDFKSAHISHYHNYVHNQHPQLEKVFLPPGSGFLRRNFPNIDDEFS